MMSHPDDEVGSNRLPFVGPDGIRWTVRELVGAGGDPPCLVFESDGIVRRVRVYPPAWEALGSEALFALSWKV
jgi:hypothetical protein